MMDGFYHIPDMHSHILPNIDDGSQSPDMTRAMLDEMTAQGIGLLAATPHFYPTRDSIDAFLARRQRAVEALRPVYNKTRHPKLFLGAEVAYFRGISRAEQIAKLTLGETRTLLLEMPFSRWSREVVEEVLAIREELDLQPILAHIERYLAHQKRSTIPELIGRGVLIQSNAEFFLNPKTAKKAMKMLEKGEIHFLGSDSHNLTDRAPNLGKAIRAIADFGLTDSLHTLERRGQELVSRFRTALPEM